MLADRLTALLGISSAATRLQDISSVFRDTPAERRLVGTQRTRGLVNRCSSQEYRLPRVLCFMYSIIGSPPECIPIDSPLRWDSPQLPLPNPGHRAYTLDERKLGDSPVLWESRSCLGILGTYISVSCSLVIIPE